MPTAAQLSRLAALEARAPASVAAMAGMSASEVREAILSLMESIGTGPDDPILCWAQTAPERDFEQFRDGVKPDHAAWGVWP
jgi:hypothetical protein